MSIGQLRDRVTFEVQARTAAGGGSFNVSWSTVVTVWGQFTPERGTERLKAGRLEAAFAGTLKVRSSTETRAITESHRVLIDAVPYQIRSIANPDRRNRFLEMSVERQVAQ